MWRAAKRAAAAVRGSAASASGRPSSSGAACEGGKSVRGQRRPLHADGLMRPDVVTWELEAIAAQGRGRAKANGERVAATAVDMVKALVRLTNHTTLTHPPHFPACSW